MAGIYWWKWFSNLDTDEEGPVGFSPRGKPAQALLRRVCRGRRPPAALPREAPLAAARHGG